jgi:hypothetical protein
MDYGLWTMNYGLWTMNLVVDYGLWIGLKRARGMSCWRVEDVESKL